VDIQHKLPYPDLTLFDDGLNTEERCGAIFENLNGELKVIEVPNRHEEPKKHFKIHTSDVNAITIEDEKLIGIVHTHPAHQYKKPSYSDVASIPEGLFGIVYHPSSKTVYWYNNQGVLNTEIRN
jgi:proteasome lid subunit RPN8/RPN11